MTATLTKKQRAALMPSEHQEQAALFDWALNRSPQSIRHLTSLLYAIPNESRVGNRDQLAGVIRGKRLKAEGRRKGFPDACLPVARSLPRQSREDSLARHAYHSLYIEIKRAGDAFESPTIDQLAWHDALREQGHYVCVAAGAVDAINAIENYLAGRAR